MSDGRWGRLDLVKAERDDLLDQVDYLTEEKAALLAELAERDATIRDLEDDLAEARRRHPSNGRP